MPDLGFRQTLLATRSEAERMRRIADFLPGYLQRRKKVQHTKDVARQQRPRASQTRMSILIFDADDTLWENNIYFEHAFDDFVDFLAHSALTPPQIRDVLNEIELVNSKIHGYGSLNFGRNLQQAYQHLAEREIRARRPGTRHVAGRADSANSRSN